MDTFRRSLKCFISTRCRCCETSCTPRLRTNGTSSHSVPAFRTLYDFTQDPGHHQQPCVYIRVSPWHTPYYIGATDQDVLHREHSRCRKYLQLFRGQHAFFEPALHYWKRANNYWPSCAIPIETRLPTLSIWAQESKWQYTLRPHLNAPWAHRLLRKIGLREHLVDFRRHSISTPASLTLHKRFRRRLHPNLHRQLRPDMMEDIQEHYYSTLCRLGSNTGASFQTMRELLSAAFPSTQLPYLLRLASFVKEPFRSKAQKLLAQVLHKRKLQVPATLTHLLLPPLHARDWKARLGLWLQQWVSSHRSLFPSLFLPKLRVVETRSATLGDRLYNYRKWQQRWTPDISFPCRCIDLVDRTMLHAHSHAVTLSDFGSINADIDSDIMSASMKDQYYGDVDKLQQRFTSQFRKLARRWNVQRSNLEVDSRTNLSELFTEHRSNICAQAYWTTDSLRPTARALNAWVVIPADHFPSRAHVICLTLFSILMNKTFRTGEVFTRCRKTCRIRSRAGCHHGSHSAATTICLGTATSSSSSHRANPAQTHQGMAQSEAHYFFLPYLGCATSHGFRGPHLQPHKNHLSRCPVPTVSSSSSEIHCHLQIFRNTYSWCHRTCQASSPPSLLNVFIKLFRSSFINMIRLLDYAMFPTGQYMKSSPTIGGNCSKASGVERQKPHGSFMRRIYRCSLTLSLTTAT